MRRRRVSPVQSEPEEVFVEVPETKSHRTSTIACVVITSLVIVGFLSYVVVDMVYIMHKGHGTEGSPFYREKNIWEAIASDTQSGVFCERGDRLDLPSGQLEAGSHAYTLHTDKALPKGAAVTENYCAHLRAMIHSYERCGRVNETQNLLNFVEFLDPGCVNASIWHYALNTYVLNCDAEGLKYVNVTDVAESELFMTCSRDYEVPVVVALDEGWRGVWCAELEVAINAANIGLTTEECPSLSEVSRAFASFEPQHTSCAGGNYTAWDSWLDSFYYNSCNDFNVGLLGVDNHEFRRQGP